jgi:ATP-dependent DNA helicase RecQ
MAEIATPSTPSQSPQFDELLGLIEKTWGFRALRPLQEPAMQAFIDRRDSLVVLPTGGGKSLCYQAPALYLSQLGYGPTVVVSPLIALMKDQVDSLKELGIAAAQLDSSLSQEERRQVASDLRGGRLHLLFVSPERLVGQEGGNGGGWFQDLLRDSGVQTFAIDEAHCISQWGHDFRPEYRQLACLKEMFPGAAVHAFTATATQQVRKDIAEQLGLEDPELLVGNFDRPNLTYRILPRRDLYAQIQDVLERHKNEAGIIYCLRRKDVDEITKTLSETKLLGRKVAGYHAGMTPDQRRRVQEAFIEEECDLIVATIAFGMGIDRSNIRFVLHTGMPKSIEAYQQETGRAGRDGLEAECVLLYSAQDAITWKSLIEKSAGEAGAGGIKIDPRFVPAALKHIDDMDRFARGAICRHKALVEYFGQPYEGPPEVDGQDARATKGCGACDMCLGDTTAVPESTVIAQKILSCIFRTEQRFGVGHVIAVLRGENTDAVRKWGHEKLSTYGILSAYPKTELRDFIYQLIGQGALAQENLVLSSGHTAGILKLNGHSAEVLKGKREVRLVQIVRKSAKEARKTRSEAISWEGVDEELFEALRGLRKEIATERSVPPYVIFSDATLRELARIRPTNMGNFRLVYGVGENKLNEFGPKFLPVIVEGAKARGLSTDVMTGGRGGEKAAGVGRGDAEEVASEVPVASRALESARAVLARPNPPREQAVALFRAGKSVEEVAVATGRARATVMEYLAEWIAEERPKSIAAWVPEEIYRRVHDVARQVGMEKLKPIFVGLNEAVPYDQIRLVVAHLQGR